MNRLMAWLNVQEKMQISREASTASSNEWKQLLGSRLSEASRHCSPKTRHVKNLEKSFWNKQWCSKIGTPAGFPAAAALRTRSCRADGCVLLELHGNDLGDTRFLHGHTIQSVGGFHGPL